MRPLKLKMSAFGPYTSTVCLDLDSLGKSGIYLITGDTGAGKTTIFDAIVYALFGKPSGTNRDESMLRSKQASPDVPTEVELVFLCKGNEYTVKRSPAYERLKKSGEGTTAVGATAELQLPNGRILTKSKEVDAEIAGIIGLNRDQFLQIAMIAQGEFLKLLLAPTDERIKIFRKLFKTASYEKLQYALAEETKKIAIEREKARQSVEQYINGILIKDFSEYEAELQRAKGGEMPISECIALIKKLIELDQVEKAECEKAYQEADKIFIDANNILSAIKENERKKEQCEGKKAELEQIKPQIIEAEAEYKKQKSEEYNAKRSQTAKQIANFDIELAKYDEIETLDNKIKNLEQELNEIQSKKQNGLSKISMLEEQIKSLEQEKEKIKNSPQNKVKYESEKSELLTKKNTLCSIENNLLDFDKIEQDYEKSLEEYSKSSANAKKLAQEYQEKYFAFLNEQAGILASELKENEPCMVCGSKVHPCPAKKSQSAPTKQELESLEALSKQAQEDALLASEKCSEFKAKKQELEKTIKKSLNDYFGQDVEIGDAKEKIATEKANIALSVKTIDDKISKEEANEKRLVEIEKQLPEINSNLTSIKDAVSKMDAQSAAVSATKAESENRKNQIQSTIKYSSKQEALKGKAKLEKQQKEELEMLENVEKLNSDLKNKEIELKTSIAELEKQLSTAKNYKKEEQEQILENAMKEKEKLSNQIQDIAARITNNKNAYNEIIKKSDEIDKLDKKYAWIKALSDTANGTLSGKEKIKLETYIQTTYFDRIIRRANIRLLVMSDGQYELKRRVEDNSKRGQSGLDLDVKDHYSGTERSVKTLSGGESFKASLSLALGLAEEIQSNAGGVQMDTMFVDEGFGSLDEDSLDQAMKALTSLGQGNRLVGIISHVAELKERIEKQIVITKDKHGGSTAKIVL